MDACLLTSKMRMVGDLQMRLHYALASGCPAWSSAMVCTRFRTGSAPSPFTRESHPLRLLTMSSRDSSDVTLVKVFSTGHGTDDDRDVQSSLVKSLLEFRKGEPFAQTFLFKKSIILTDPP